MNHQFGIVIFVPEIPPGTYPTAAYVPEERAPEDPFCYHCGQKKINAKPGCPGPSKYSINSRVYT